MPLIDVRHGKINYVQQGPKGIHIVVFLHGFMQSSAIWLPTMRKLPKTEFRCLAFDLPGFGGSSHLDATYTVEGMADSVRQALQKLKIGRFSMVANAFGTRVAQNIAARYPHLVYKLVLVAARAFTASPTEALEEADRLAQLEWTLENLAERIRRHYGKKPRAQFLEKMIAVAHATDRAAAVAVARANARANTLNLLHRIQARTLIIQGGRDPSCTLQDAEYLRLRIPTARLVVIPEAGHSPMIDAPEAFATHMLGLLREL